MNTFFRELELGKILEGWNLALWRANTTLRFHQNEYIFPRVWTRKNPWRMKSSLTKSELNTLYFIEMNTFFRESELEKSLRDEPCEERTQHFDFTKINTYFWGLELEKYLWGMKSSLVKSELCTQISPKRIHFPECWNSEKSLGDEI